MNRPVTVGVDGSPESLAAARWAAAEALRRGTPLRLLLAWPWLFNAPPTVRDPDTGLAQEMLQEIRDGLLKDHPGLEITADRIADHPVEVLVTAAEQAELLVLGSRGLGPVTGFLVGSVGLLVLGRATCPVVLVRTADGAAVDTAATVEDARDVVLGVELDRPCGEVIDFAFRTAAQRSARLRAVRVWSLAAAYGYSAIPLSVDLTTGLAAEAERVLNAALRPWREKYPQVEVTEQAVLGSAGQVLTETAGEAALLVVGRRVRTSPVGMHIGPVTYAVLHHARCPVAVVPYH